MITFRIIGVCSWSPSWRPPDCANESPPDIGGSFSAANNRASRSDSLTIAPSVCAAN
jgi:hypothetical protein